MKRDPDADLSRDFTVRYCEWGAYVVGDRAPTDDVSALLKTWAYRGYRFISVAVTKKLGCLVAVCEHAGDEMSWLEKLAEVEAPV